VLDGLEEGQNVVEGISGGAASATKRGRVKAPNPLSVRKKKAPVTAQPEKGESSDVAKRKRERTEKHTEVEAVSADEADSDLLGGRRRKRKRRGKGVVAVELQAGVEPYSNTQ